MWILFAIASALFGGVVAILAKIGLKNVNSNLAIAIRTVVVAIFAWLMVFVVGSHVTIKDVEIRTLIFLILSGFATGGSWICYYRALQIGDVNKVVPVDKMSTVLTILLSFIILGEGISLLKMGAVVLIGSGTYLMIERKKTSVGNNLERSTESEFGDVSIKKSRDIKRQNDVNSPQDEHNSFGQIIIESRASLGFLINDYRWLVYAALAAVFASMVAILGKIGITNIESNLGTAIRTLVVLIFAWSIVFAQSKHREIRQIDKRSWLFLILSGFATGLSWLCFYRALQEGPVSVVVPIDKLSIIVTIAFSYFILREKLKKKSIFGLLMIITGTLSLLAM